MKGLSHLIIILVGTLGLLLGNVLIDLDHRGSWACKWKGFWVEKNDCTFGRGMLHTPIIILSLAIFFICLGLGILIHILQDYIKW